MSERLRRWRLALGVDDDAAGDAGRLNARDARIDAALSALYGGGAGGGRGAGLGASSPRVARWLGDIREFFPSSVVRVIQRDAMERLGLRQLLLEPEILETLDADVHLVADLIALGSALPDETLETARAVVQKVVDELMALLAHRTAEAVRGALDRSRRTARPRMQDVDWGRTILRNLDHWIPEHRTVVPERLVGFGRRSRRMADLDEVILCVDQSGSMATSVVYASIFSAVLASLPALKTRLVCFDTAVVDLTDELEDPVSVLFGVQLGGGTDIHRALGYVEGLVTSPQKTHVVLISDLFEGGDPEGCLARAASLVAAGVQLIVLLALSDDGRPGYDPAMAGEFAALGCPVFACTPDEFPELMAAALGRADLAAWAGGRGISLVQASDEAGPAPQ